MKETVVRDNKVAFLGIATGTFSHDGALKPENSWTVPAAWRAVIEDERVAVWQLYVNTEAMLRILERLGEA